MKLGIGFSHENFTVENLLYARQLGVTDVIVHGPRLGDNGVLEYDELVQVKRMATEQGLRLAAIENLPRDHWHDVLHAGSDRDNQIENAETPCQGRQ